METRVAMKILSRFSVGLVKQDQKSTRCDISYVFPDFPVFPDILMFPDFPVLPDFLDFKVFLNFSVFPDFPDF